MRVAFRAAAGLLLLMIAVTGCHSSEVRVKTGAGRVRLQVVSPEIVRVSVSPDG